jgi:hypothetical protein
MSAPTTTNEEAAMGQAIPTQHPAVVLRSHYTHLRILLAVAMTAVIGLSIAVAILAGAADRSESAGTVLVVPAPTGQRYDGGPDEGTRGIVALPSTRYDGGPDEGSRGPGH